MTKTIMIVAGEASGDLYGAELAKELRALCKDLKLIGMGGWLMAESGVELIAEMSDLSGIGIIEVATKAKRFFETYFRVKRYLKEVDIVVLIDFPEFNIRLSKDSHRLGIPSVYYFPPTVWAWRRGRAKTIATFCKLVISVLPFEKEIFVETGANVIFVGHPLIDIVKSSLNRANLYTEFGLSTEKKTIGLLPGSRISEITALLKIMLETAGEIFANYQNVQFIIPQAPNFSPGYLNAYLPPSLPYTIKIVYDNTYNVMNLCDLLIIASGTATLEAGIVGKPMIIVYKLHPITWIIAKLLVKTTYIGLPNIIAKKEICPEFLQDKCTPTHIAKKALDLLNDSALLTQMGQMLSADVRSKLGPYGASNRAAKAILDIC